MPAHAMDPSEHLRPDEFLQHREFLCRLARSLLRDAARAEDVVHGAFALSLERPPRDAQSLGLWLRTTVRRLAFNVRRDEGRRRAREQAMVRPEACEASDEAAASLEIQELVIGAVRSLPEPYRTTLWLRYYEDLSRKDIARRQGVPERTVQTRLARGQAQLREELDRRSGGDRREWLGGIVALARSGSRPGVVTLGGIAATKSLWIAAAVLVGLVAWRWRAHPARSAPEVATTREAALRADAPPRTPALREEPRAPLATTGADEERAVPTTAALTIRVRWSDGSPAGDVGLCVFPEDDPLGERHVVCVRSDADGRAEIDALHPGSIRVEIDRGGERTIDVAAGERGELELEVARGVTVEGTVAEAAGAPVADAQIVLTRVDSNSWLATRVAARTAPNGAYSIRDVSTELSVGARSGAWTPSPLVPLRGRAPGSVARIDLVFETEGAAMHGRVLDPDRWPVAGARVAVGDSTGYSGALDEFTAAEWRGMQVATTDASGRFEVRGVDMTRGLPVAVLAEGFPIAVQTFAGRSATSTFAEIVLERPRALIGCVRDGAGAFVAGATLRVRCTAEMREEWVPFALPCTTTDAAGRYRLELLPDAPLGIHVTAPPGRALGSSFVRLTPAAGETALDVVLCGDESIHGRVLDARGNPWQGATVAVWGPGLRQVRVDPDGAFRVAGCARPPYSLTVRDDAERSLLDVREVGPSPDELVLRIEDPGSLWGVLVQSSPPKRAPQAWVDPADRGSFLHAEWAGDRFTFPSLRPGMYRLFVQANAMLRLGWFSVGPGERVDVGTICTEAGGDLRIELDPSPSGAVAVTLLGPAFDVAEPDLFEDGLRGDGIPPGTYFLCVEADGYAMHLEPVEIRGGEETLATVRLEPGVARTLAFSVAPQMRWRWIRVAVRDALGRTCFGRHEERYAERPSVLALLAPGEYALEAETDTGLVAQGSFSVDGLTAQDSPLVFELR